MASTASTFAATFAALYAAHSFGDHWIQTHDQALTKGGAGRAGQLACLRHVATLTTCKTVALFAVVWATDLRLNLAPFVVALVIDAVSHYWADRRITLRRLAKWLGKEDFYDLGQHSRCMGTGAYALDQSWHVAWLFVASLIIAAGGAA
jgi:hypothetical protein